MNKKNSESISRDSSRWKNSGSISRKLQFVKILKWIKNLIRNSWSSKLLIFYIFDIPEDLDETMDPEGGKRNAWSMGKLENLERSSRIFRVTLLAECLARPDFSFAMESFLHFFFPFFPFFPSFPFVTNNICQSHLYPGRVEIQNETKKLRMISLIRFVSSVYILLPRNFHASRNKISRFPLTRVRVNFLLLDELYFFSFSLPLFSILNRFKQIVLNKMKKSEATKYSILSYIQHFR